MSMTFVLLVWCVLKVFLFIIGDRHFKIRKTKHLLDNVGNGNDCVLRGTAINGKSTLHCQPISYL